MKAIFVEVSGFAQVREQYLTDDSYRLLQLALMLNPKAGVVMHGCAGLRKIRMGDAERGKGKRGGIRLIYLHIPEVYRFYMIDIYGKDEQDDLSPLDKKIFRQLAIAVKAQAIANS